MTFQPGLTTFVYGAIKDNGGDVPRKASKIDYGVWIQMPEPTGAIEWPVRVVPQGYRPPDAVDTQPRPVGCVFHATLTGFGSSQRLTVFFDEFPAWDECPAPAGGGSLLAPTTGGGGQGGTTPGGGGGPGGPIGGIGGGIGPGGGTD